MALRANERAAAALQVNIARTKLFAFAIASVLAGVAGVLAGYRYGGIATSQYAAMASVTALAIVFIGGMAQISGALVAGAIIGGGLFSAVLNRFIEFHEFELLVAGVGLIFASVRNPEGIAGFVEEVWHSIKRRFTRRRSPAEVDAITPTGSSALTLHQASPALNPEVADSGKEGTFSSA